MKDKQIKGIALSGVMTALIFAMTWLPRLPVPAASGYIHLGDGMICLAAMLVGPSVVVAAALGSALADVAGGYAMYALPSFLIKGAMALVVCALYRPRRRLLALLAFSLGETVMVLGYFAADWLLYGGAAAFAGAGSNALQAFGGIAIGMLCRPMTERLKKALG